MTRHCILAFILLTSLFAAEICYYTGARAQILFHHDSLTQEDPNEIQILYKNEMAGGVLAHSHGFGAFFRRARHITGFRKWMMEAELANIRHPKETKVYNPNLENPKGFIYGKLNNFYVIRTGVGLQQVIVSKLGEGKVEVRYVTMVGISNGFLKPVYLVILPSYGEGRKVEKYDPLKHAVNDIYGKAPFSRGLEELDYVPGAFIKFALQFEYSPSQEGMKAIETGIAIDFFDHKIPVMAAISGYEDPNNNIFFNLYVSFLMGEKWF